MAKGEKVEPNFGGLRVVPIYMSRGFEENPEKNRHYEAVREKFEEKIEIANNSMYKVGTHEAGDRDEITMVTFIGGLFLDNIGHVSKGDGYMDLYEGSSQSGFIASHHTIGVGGNWNRWSTMYEWAVDSGKTYDENDFGAYVYRDTVRDVDEEFLSEVMIADTSEEEDPRDIFLNMLEVGTYESSFPLTDRAIEATDD